MAKSERTPTEALALGMLAELLRRSPDAAPAGSKAGDGQGQSQAQGDNAGHGHNAADAILVAATAYEDVRERARAAKARASAGAREVAQHNAERASALLQRGKLEQRMEALRRSQLQAATPELARQLRRQRAEVAVQAEAVDVALARHDVALAGARDGLATAQKEAAQAFAGSIEAGAALQALQRRAEPLATAFAALHDRLGKAACRLYLATARAQAAPPAGHAAHADVAAVGAWRQQVQLAAGQLSRLHAAMAQGRYAKDEVDPYMGGRATVTGEVLCALVASGQAAAAAALFDRACPPDQFFHQMLPVYRAYAVGLCAAGRWAAVAEATRLHRYADGLHGALAQCLWSLLHNDGQAFALHLAAVVVQDWRTWSHTQTPAMGLVSTTACALARLARARGLFVPQDLGPTVPAVLWLQQGD